MCCFSIPITEKDTVVFIILMGPKCTISWRRQLQNVNFCLYCTYIQTYKNEHPQSLFFSYVCFKNYTTVTISLTLGKQHTSQNYAKTTIGFITCSLVCFFFVCFTIFETTDKFSNYINSFKIQYSNMPESNSLYFHNKRSGPKSIILRHLRIRFIL